MESFLPLSPSSVLLLFIAALSILWLWTKSRRPYTKYNIPPFPEKPSLFVGHLPQLRCDIRDRVSEWRKKAGDVFSIDILGQHTIVLCSYDLIKEVLVKRAEHVPNCPPSMGDHILKEYNKGIIGAKDENWKEQRTATLNILRDFGMGRNILGSRIQEEVTVFIDKLASLKGHPENIRTLTNISVSNVICAIIIGKRFEHDDPYFIRFIHALNDVLKYFTDVQLVSSFPILYYLPGDMFHIQYWAKCVRYISERFSKHYIRKIKENLNKDEEPDNFIAAYLQELDRLQKKGEATLLSEENLVCIIRTLFGAGTETTSTTILWCLVYMLHYSEVQEKVYREIENHVGTERSPSWNDKPNLTYLNAVIMETQRICSLAISGLRREVKSTFEAGGYTFPKGTAIWPFITEVLKDEKVWGDPHKFRPERFLDSSGGLVSPDEWIPFCIGRRVCLGSALAKMELFLFLANMFQRFRFEREDQSVPLPSLKGIFGSTITPEPFKLRFIDRRGWTCCDQLK